MPTVPRDAALDASSIARGAANLRERPVDSGAVNAGVLALQNLGQAVKEAAGVPADFSLRLQKAQNTADIARADVIMRDAFAAHQDRMQKMPEAQWEETWKTEGLKSVREQIDALGLSQAARDQLTPDLIQWEGATSIQVRTQATKQTIGNNRLAVKNGVDRAVIDGDYELAISHYNNGVKSGLFSPEEGDAGIVDIEQRVKIKAKEDQSSGIALAIETDPGAAIPELEKAARGEVSVFGELEPLKAKRFLAMAEREDKNRKVELRTDLHNRVIAGDILDMETLHREAGGLLDEKTMQSLEKVMGKEIVFNPDIVSKIRTAISGYDPENDQGGKQYDEIMSSIESAVPQNRQGILAAELNKTWTNGTRKGKEKDQVSLITSEVYKQIDKLGVLGVYDEKQIRDQSKKELEANRLSPEVQSRRGNRELELKRKFDDWIKQNTNPTSDQIETWIMGETAKDILKSGAKVDKSNKLNLSSIIPALAEGLSTGGRRKTKEELIKEIDDEIQLPSADPDELIQ